MTYTVWFRRGDDSDFIDIEASNGAAAVASARSRYAGTAARDFCLAGETPPRREVPQEWLDALDALVGD